MGLRSGGPSRHASPGSPASPCARPPPLSLTLRVIASPCASPSLPPVRYNYEAEAAQQALAAAGLAARVQVLGDLRGAGELGDGHDLLSDALTLTYNNVLFSVVLA
jgi:hypothetical protein